MQCCFVLTLFGVPPFISVSVPIVGWYFTNTVPVALPELAVGWPNAVAALANAFVGWFVWPNEPKPVVLVGCAWPNNDVVGCGAVWPNPKPDGLAAPNADVDDCPKSEVCGAAGWAAPKIDVFCWGWENPEREFQMKKCLSNENLCVILYWSDSYRVPRQCLALITRTLQASRLRRIMLP